MTCARIASLIEMPHVDPLNTVTTGMKQLNKFYAPSVNDRTTFSCAQSCHTRIETDHPSINGDLIHHLAPFCQASPDGAAALGTSRVAKPVQPCTALLRTVSRQASLTWALVYTSLACCSNGVFAFITGPTLQEKPTVQDDEHHF